MTTPRDDTVGDGPAADPAPADRLARLREQIRTAHLRAGRPSYREISRSTGHAVSHTTVSKIIRCDCPPAWASLEPVLNALGADVDTIRELWVALHQPEAAPAGLQADATAPSAPTGPAATDGPPDQPDPSAAAQRARRSSRRSQTTVFTMGSDLYMTAFYKFLAGKIAEARHSVYITGDGVTETGGEPLHPDLAAAPWTALRNGAHVVRVQTTPIIGDFWFSQLHAMVTEFPQTFELRALATPVNVTRVHLCAIDVDDPDRNVAEMMLQTPRYLGTRRLNLATTAMFVEGHQLLAQSFRDQILDLGTTAPAEHLTSGPAVERFFRGEHYFAYGSNMDQAQMTQRCPSARLLGPATLPDHRLVFNRSGTYRPGRVANLQASP
ncbi:MAG TPA: gamma-glutamylcyclotransferase family protein, partial [Kineosporiaceae bacterium]